MAKNKEHDSYTEIASYLHRDEGEARVETYTSVNAPIKVSGSKTAEQISKVRVTMHVEEDKGVTREGGFYMKKVSMSQTRDDQTPQPTASNGRSEPPYSQQRENGSDLPAWGKVLKNLVDEVSANTRLAIVLGVLGIVIAAGAVIIAVM